MKTTITTTEGGTWPTVTTWTTVSNLCPQCGRPKYMVWSGIIPPPPGTLCECPVSIPSMWLGTLAETPERQAWECPRCQRVNAPHVDQCGCQP